MPQPLELLKLKGMMVVNFDKEGKQLEFSYFARRNTKWYSHIRKQFGNFLTFYPHR